MCQPSWQWAKDTNAKSLKCQTISKCKCNINNMTYLVLAIRFGPTDAIVHCRWLTDIMILRRHHYLPPFPASQFGVWCTSETTSNNRYNNLSHLTVCQTPDRMTVCGRVVQRLAMPLTRCSHLMH